MEDFWTYEFEERHRFCSICSWRRFSKFPVKIDLPSLCIKYRQRGNILCKNSCIIDILRQLMVVIILLHTLSSRECKCQLKLIIWCFHSSTAVKCLLWLISSKEWIVALAWTQKMVDLEDTCDFILSSNLRIQPIFFRFVIHGIHYQFVLIPHHAIDVWNEAYVSRYQIVYLIFCSRIISVL